MFEYNPDLPAVFYRLPDGMTGAMQTHNADLVIPEGAVQITYEEWQAEQDARLAAKEARKASELEAKQAAEKVAYEELRTLGVSEAPARFMSGYTGPA